MTKEERLKVLSVEQEKDLNREYFEKMLEEATEIIKQVASFDRTDQLAGHDIIAASKKFLNPRTFKEDTFTSEHS